MDVGYGPASTFSTAQVSEMSIAYSAVTEDQLVEMLDPREMGNVYPEVLWARNDEETKAYASENFKALQTYLSQASKLNLGIVTAYT